MSFLDFFIGTYTSVVTIQFSDKFKLGLPQETLHIHNIESNWKLKNCGLLVLKVFTITKKLKKNASFNACTNFKLVFINAWKRKMSLIRLEIKNVLSLIKKKKKTKNHISLTIIYKKKCRNFRMSNFECCAFQFKLLYMGLP